MAAAVLKLCEPVLHDSNVGGRFGLCVELLGQHELHLFGIEFHDHVQHHIVDEEDHLFRLADEELTAAEHADLEHAMVAIENRMTSS
jgi:hypothetical protein